MFIGKWTPHEKLVHVYQIIGYMRNVLNLTLGASEVTAESDPLSGPPEIRDLAPHFYGLRTARIRSTQVVASA